MRDLIEGGRQAGRVCAPATSAVMGGKLNPGESAKLNPGVDIRSILGHYSKHDPDTGHSQ